MKIRLFAVVVACAATMTAAPTAVAAPVLYKLDGAHTVVSFRIKHLGLTNVNGTITGVEGTARLDEADAARSEVLLTLDMNTLATGVAKRDAHLKGADFFDVAKFPKATFKSTKVEKGSEGFKVTGDLTIRDVTRPIVLMVDAPTPAIKNPAGAIVRGTSATATIVRKDFNLTWNKVVEGVDLVGADAKLTIDIELIQAVDQPATK